MPFESRASAHLTRGVNLRGLTASVTMREGDAQDAVDMLPREDGAVYQIFGWERVNDTALTGRPIGVWGFDYRGKNSPAGDTARGGNFSQANSAADFTKRANEFSGYILLTTTTFYRWNPTTSAFASVSLPAGAAVDVVKPSFAVVNDCVYIVGWADKNLRYDPTDLALYRWGWEAVPGVPTLAAQSGGDLIVGGKYKYAYSFSNVYTAEESFMSAAAEITIAGVNRTARVTVVAYTGDRHFNDLATSTDSDARAIIWRTMADQEEFYFITSLEPGTLTYDDGDSLGFVADLLPARGTQQDEPRFTAFQEFRGRFHATTRFDSSNRVFFSDNSFYERYRVRSFYDLPVTEGDALTAIGATDTTILAHTRRGGFRVTANETGDIRPQIIQTRLPWEAGAVGPRARETRNGFEYWLSERGPMRWGEGMRGPEWIGKPLAPMFIDPNSDLCKLNESARELSELGFDWASNTMRFLFATGVASFPDQQWAYWIDSEKYNQDAESGWFPLSPRAQTMTSSHSLAAAASDGTPISALSRIERMTFADDEGYVYEYGLRNTRGGLKQGAVAKTEIDAGSTASSAVTTATMFTAGDGLAGMRIEIVNATTGVTIQVRKVASNTANAIVPTVDFNPTPVTGEILYIGGIPAFWRSWVDHMGDPHMHKSLLHVNLGYQRTAIGEPAFQDFRLDVNIGSGEFPTAVDRVRTASVTQYRRRVLVNLTAVFFYYEVMNSRPDESWVLTNIDREIEPVLSRRRA